MVAVHEARALGYIDRMTEIDNEMDALDRSEDDAMKKGLPGDKHYVKKKLAAVLRRRRLHEAFLFVLETIKSWFEILKAARGLLSHV